MPCLDKKIHLTRASLDNAVEAIITIDSIGTIETVNHATYKMFGYATQEIIGQNVRMLMPEPFKSEHDHYLSRYLTTDSPKIIGTGREALAVRQTGEIFPIHLSVSEVHDQGKRSFVGLIRDITTQRLAEQQSREHRDELAHADRLNMLGEMASGIAHEINQPLTAISLFAQAGKRFLESGKHDRIPDIFDQLSQHALRAGAVVESMQNFARRGENQREATQCSRLINKIVDFAESEARMRDVIVSLDEIEQSVTIVVDVVQIQQVVLNLLRNGMEAMQSVNFVNGNLIKLQTTLREDGDLEVAVIDSGSGVSEDEKSTLFTPFSSTKEKGMGMGLSICREIITAHGGHLMFKNLESGGAKFYFTLPIERNGASNG